MEGYCSEGKITHNIADKMWIIKQSTHSDKTL